MVQSLYKYCKFVLEDQRTEKQLSMPTLWFSPPERLNDPFECQPKFIFPADPKQEIEVLVNYLRKKHEGRDIVDLLEEALALQRGGKFSEMKEKIAQDVLLKIKREIGVCCFSAKSDSILMWSHYAGDHTGYCVEFEAIETTPFFGAAQEVEYHHSYPTVDFFNTPHEKQVDLIFLTKYIDWRYEAEWRIYDYDSGPGLKEYPAELMRSVTFGVRMPREHREQIKNWISRRGHPVAFFQAFCDADQFKINMKPAD